MAEYWNLVQTVGWIVLRDDEFVKRADDDAPQGTINKKFALPNGETRWEKVPVGWSNRLSICVWRSSQLGTDGLNPMPSDDAIKELLDHLKRGTVAAHGVRGRGEGFSAISPLEWSGLEFKWNDSKGDKPGMCGAVPSGYGSVRAGWSELRFDADQIRELWPADDEQDEVTWGEAGRVELDKPGARPATIKVETQCTAWLVARLKEDREAGRIGLLRADYQRLAQQAHGVSERGFLNRIWPEAIRQTGFVDLSKGGRRPKKSPHKTEAPGSDGETR